jgi:PAS domain S-box-containing protein
MALHRSQLALLNVDFERLVGEHSRALGESHRRLHGAHDGIEREQAEATLHASEQTFRALLEALPAAVYTTDAEGRITFYNQAAVELSGHRPKLGSHWCVTWRLYWPDGTPLPHDECPMAIALKENRPVRGAEAIAERPDGTRVPFIPYPTPLRDAAGALVGAVNMLVDITERKQAEERLQLLAQEVDHRANNLLALVQASVRLTKAETVEAFKVAVEGRIQALANAHALLASSRWVGASLGQLVEDELAPYRSGREPAARVNGARVMLEPKVAQTMAVVLHELATNAAKYGALSMPAGHVDLDWWPTADGRFMFRWVETGGPAVVAPKRRGFGTGVVERMIRDQLDGELRLDWRPEGLICEIALRADEVARAMA